MIYKEIIGIACFAIMFVTNVGSILDFKPFNCLPCASTWIALIYFCITHKIGFETLGYTGVTFFVSMILYYIFKRVKGLYL